jgi:hypothetical protein
MHYDILTIKRMVNKRGGTFPEKRALRSTFNGPGGTYFILREEGDSFAVQSFDPSTGGYERVGLRRGLEGARALAYGRAHNP